MSFLSNGPEILFCFVSPFWGRVSILRHLKGYTLLKILLRLLFFSFFSIPLLLVFAFSQCFFSNYNKEHFDCEWKRVIQKASSRGFASSAAATRAIEKSLAMLLLIWEMNWLVSFTNPSLPFTVYDLHKFFRLRLSFAIDCVIRRCSILFLPYASLGFLLSFEVLLFLFPWFPFM